MDPAASVTKGMKTVAVEKGGRNRLTPFQEPRKRDHMYMSRSLRNSLLSRITEVGLERPRVRAIIRRRKGRPGATTLHAKWRDPISDCRSWRRQALLDAMMQSGYGAWTACRPGVVPPFFGNPVGCP